MDLHDGYDHRTGRKWFLVPIVVVLLGMMGLLANGGDRDTLIPAPPVGQLSPVPVPVIR